jgi:hypothetical protein
VDLQAKKNEKMGVVADFKQKKMGVGSYFLN